MGKSVVVSLKEKEIPSVVSRKIRYDNLRKFEPLTQVQEQIFKEYKKGKNLVLHGCAGTGKSFLAMYLALNEILLREANYEKLVIVRSAVPSRDVGFLPGDLDEKTEIYELPYHAILREVITGVPDMIEKAKNQGLYQFITSSYIRGITLHNSIVVVDECQNFTFGELNTIITRLGENCKIVFCGDVTQTDLHHKKDVEGFKDFMKIVNKMPSFTRIEMGLEDIVRSSLVKEYLVIKHEMGL